MELKKPHPSRQVEGWRCETGWSYIYMWWIKFQEGYFRSEKSQPHTKPLAQGSSARNINPHNFLLQKLAGIDLVKETSGV